jgi:tetratricopeptide (TPR) repeat protein
MSEPPASSIDIKGNVDNSNIIFGNNNAIYTAPPIPVGEPNPFGVPYQRNRYFAGRQTVLRELHEQLTQATATAITQVQAISGLGGVGKTQTAVEYAYRHFYDEPTYKTVFWVKADTEVNLATDFAGIAQQLVLPMAQATQTEQIPAVRAWLATHGDWLLIFDNADTPEWLTSFMPSHPQGKVLVTSRASVFDALGIQQPLALDVLLVEEALDLLFERTGCARTEENIAAATELNQELDGLPLALEQASAFVLRQKIDFATYLKTYRKRGLSQLEKEKAKTGQYPLSVLTTWKINFEAVAAENEAAAALLELSAFLASDEIPYCILTAGAAHLGEVLSAYLAAAAEDNDDDETRLAIGELLALLSRYSLVKWEAKRQVYSVHRLVQAAVRDGMDQVTADEWLERVVGAIASAYPGKDVSDWAICAQLLPHWLQLSKQDNKIGHKSVAMSVVLSQAGYYLYEQGRYSEAEALYEQALPLKRQLLGENHPSLAFSLNNLAQLRHSQGRYDEAEPLFEEALAIHQRLLGAEHPSVADSLNNLAALYGSQGRYSEAEPAYKRALAINLRSLGENHPHVAANLSGLAYLYYTQGRYSEAEPIYKKALAISLRLLGENHPSVAIVLNNLALLYFDQEDYTQAELMYKKALAIKIQLLGEKHPSVVLGMNNLAQLYFKQGRYSEAESM